jgi:hypothetical protein
MVVTHLDALCINMTHCDQCDACKLWRIIIVLHFYCDAFSLWCLIIVMHFQIDHYNSYALPLRCFC